MIISNEIEIIVSSSNYKWFLERGYGPFSKGDKISAKVKDINSGSSYRIDVQCKNCNEIINVQINNYNNQMKKQNFYVCKNCSYTKMKVTNIERYGSECALRSDINIEKSKKTMIKKYGYDNISKVDFIKEERSDMMKLNTNDYNEIIKEKYGSNVSKLDWIKEKKKETTFKNWGVENPSQNAELFEKSQKSGKKIKLHESGLWYRGTYEKDFLDYCFDKNIKVEKGPTIKFNFNGKNKYYHSDFYIPDKNLIIEIKSSYYYDKFKEINEIKKEETLKAGHNHIFIINKNYEEFIKLFGLFKRCRF